MGKLWALRNKEKRSSTKSLREKIVGEPERKLNQDTWGFLEAWDPRDMQQGQVGIEIA